MAFYIRNGITTSNLCDSSGRIGYAPNGSTTQNATFEGGDGVNLFNGKTIRSPILYPSGPTNRNSGNLYVRSGLVLEEIIEGTSGASETDSTIHIELNHGNHYPGYHKIVFTQYQENESSASPHPRFRLARNSDELVLSGDYCSFGSLVRSDSLSTRSWHDGGAPSLTSHSGNDSPTGSYGYWFNPVYEPNNDTPVPFCFEMDVFNAMLSDRPTIIQTRVGYADSTLTRTFSEFNSFLHMPQTDGSAYYTIGDIFFYEGETASSSPQITWRAYVYTPWMQWDD